MQPSGIVTASGLRQPALSGMSSSTSVRNTYSTAAMQTADGALKLFGSWDEVPVKSILAFLLSSEIFMETRMRAPLSSG